MPSLEEELDALLGGAPPPKLKKTPIGQQIAQAEAKTVTGKSSGHGRPKAGAKPAPARAPAVKPASQRLAARATINEEAPSYAPPMEPVAARAEGYKGLRPPPFERLPRDVRLIPKHWPPGEPKVGDSVWYCGSRYFVIKAPADWSDTSFVSISTHALREGSQVPKDVLVQTVHADALEKAQIHKTIYHDQPTQHAEATAAKKKELGITDVGDDIGAMLRGKSVDEAYKIAAKFMHVGETELRAKYERLNPGQQRMNLGNRMRGYLKKGGTRAI